MTESDTPVESETDDAGGWLLGSAAAPVVVVDRLLDATPDEVWAAWTRPEQLRRWLGAVAVPMDRPNGRVLVAMAAATLPDDPATAENPATFEVRTATPPTGSDPGVLRFVFDDRDDPGGLVTVTLTPTADGRCRLLLQHALLPRDEAVDGCAGFGAGWEGFLDWLADLLDGRPRGDDGWEHRVPAWDRLRERLRRTTDGRVEADGTVVHESLVAATPEAVWDLVASPAGLAPWLGDADTAPGEGVTFSVIHASDEPTPWTQTSTVEVWEPPHRLGITWAFPDEPTSRVTFLIEPVEPTEPTEPAEPAGVGLTRLRIEHRGLAPDHVEGYRVGWHAHGDLLVATAEGYGVPRFSDALAAADRPAG